MKKLISGIVDFRQKSLMDYREKFAKLAYEQNPDTLFIACCDSRVVPNTFASTDPGDLFVLRNIGNLVPPYHCHLHENQEAVDVSVAAALEFSVAILNISDIIVCGHSDCGAMQSFFEKLSTQQFPYLSDWLAVANVSYERFQKEMSQYPSLSSHNILSQINVLQQLDHLKTYPWIEERLQNKTLRIHGWWFDLATADVYHYDSDAKTFKLIDEQEAGKMVHSL